MNNHSDIIVVGAGPIGLSFCRGLAGLNLSITIIDPHSKEELADPPFDGREIALTHPSKAILEKRGIWQQVASDDIFKLKQAKVLNGESDYALHFPIPTKNSKKQAVDTLGYFIANKNIRQACYASVENQKNIAWQLNRKVKTAFSDADKATVVLDNGERLTCNLLVAADSRYSIIRKQMGIASDIFDYGRTVLVFRLQHEIANDHTACEHFFYGTTLGLLPLSDNVTNCVITIDSSKAQALRSMDNDELAEYVSKQINHRFGKMTLISEVIEYPLVGVHAQRFYTTRCALIGDAACGMHPVTAQGFNLGLKSQDILARLIMLHYRRGYDVGNDTMLKQYNLRHQINSRILYHGTNTVVRLFTNDSMPARMVRKGVIRFSNRVPPIKQLITRHLTG